MEAKIHLTVPNPCYENWDGMSPVPEGRFCNRCQRVVIDFTRMTDHELLEYFKTRQKQNLCGRFHSSQLMPQTSVAGSFLRRLKYGFALALSSFFLLLKSTFVKSQNPEKPNVCYKDTVQDMPPFILGMVAPGVHPVSPPHKKEKTTQLKNKKSLQNEQHLRRKKLTKESGRKKQLQK
ncbi:MAG: hypothetical protein N2747_02740 [Chitinophagaceae bacterium]|nr:hypothetical protein [Chitinophagaceae bacterium]